MRNPLIKRIQLHSTWRAFVYRMAVNGACLTALLSLLCGASVSTASLRGGALWLVLLLIGSLGRWLLEKSFPDLVEQQTPYEFDPRDLV